MDDVGGADRVDQLPLDKRYAPGHVEVPVGERSQAPEHLPLGRPDHRAGVDDHGVRLIRPGQPAPETFQYRFQPPGVGMVVGAAVTLDVDLLPSQIFYGDIRCPPAAGPPAVHNLSSTGGGLRHWAVFLSGHNT